MLTFMRTALKTLWRTDARLTAVGVLMIALLAANAVALAIDPREIAGAPAWLKPAKFAASIAILTLTLAWVFTYLSDWPRLRSAVSWITVVTLLLEIVIIDGQAWRGTTSHFNVATPLDGTLFSIMGFAILVQTASMVALAAALWRQRFSNRAMGWALRLGIVITIVGASSGGLMIRLTGAQLEDLRAGRRLATAGGHTIGAADGGPGLPGTGWSVEHGDLRVAHFLGLHGLQVLPLITLAIGRLGWAEARRVRLVWAISVSYLSLFAVLLWQATRGQSVIRPDATTLGAIAFWLVGTAVVVGLAALRSRSSGMQTVA
jgi:hypothetical protein